MKFDLLKLDPRLTGELHKHRRSIALGLICTTGATILGSGALIKIVDVTVGAVEARNQGLLVAVAFVLVGVYLVKYWFTRGQVYFLTKAATEMTTDLRLRLYQKLQRLPVSYFNEKRAGAIQSVLTNDVGVYQNAVSTVREAIEGPMKVVIGFSWIWWKQWQLSIFAFAVFPLIWLVVQRNQRKMRRAQDQVQSDLSDLTAMMQESLQGTRIIKAFSAEEQMTDQFGNLLGRSLDSQLAAARRVAALRPTVELIGAVGLAAVVLFASRLVSLGLLTTATLASFLIALDVINQGLRNIGSLKQTLAQVESGTERIYSQVLEVSEGQIDLPNAKTLAKPSGRIEFRNVSFVYPDGTEALHGVSFEIEPGTSMALVGPSGSGKSTIADLMLRFYDPTDGQILFDGVDIRELKVNWLRSQIGVVPQHTFLFAGSISDNIRLGNPAASEEEVHEAAKAAHADVFVLPMPNSYETNLGERGVRLSGGEMQRIAIARALVRKPALLLLDEATSSLDAHSERAVQEALDEIMRARTTLFIAHRLTTASRADNILVLRKGEVLETGSHKKLMEQNGAYAAMVRAFGNGVLETE